MDKLRKIAGGKIDSGKKHQDKIPHSDTKHKEQDSSIKCETKQSFPRPLKRPLARSPEKGEQKNQKLRFCRKGEKKDYYYSKPGGEGVEVLFAFYEAETKTWFYDYHKFKACSPKYGNSSFARPADTPSESFEFGSVEPVFAYSEVSVGLAARPNRVVSDDMALRASGIEGSGVGYWC